MEKRSITIDDKLEKKLACKRKKVEKGIVEWDYYIVGVDKTRCKVKDIKDTTIKLKDENTHWVPKGDVIPFEKAKKMALSYHISQISDILKKDIKYSVNFYNRL
ncbi:MAG: hypothetical protein ACOC1K_02475 [Nanoarchaeota archaeon]